MPPPFPAQWFCSLGNSHFFGALNLFRTNWPSIFTGRRYAMSPGDPALRRAVEEGVESVVLRSETPRAARKEISLLLNKCHDAKWAVSETGEARCGALNPQLPTRALRPVPVPDRAACNSSIARRLCSSQTARNMINLRRCRRRALFLLQPLPSRTPYCSCATALLRLRAGSRA